MEKNFFISKKSIIKNAKIGKGAAIWHYCNIYGCDIGDNTHIGSYCEIKENVVIGSHCRIQAFVFICEGVVIQNYVFIGPQVTFLNDKYPTAQKAISKTWKCEKTIICSYASIGGGVTICPGIRIAEGTVVGAGSCVTKDTEAFSIIMGNPAKKTADLRDEKYAGIYKGVIEALKDMV